MEKLSTNSQENNQDLQSQFENAMDFLMRDLELSGTKAALFALDGLVSKQIITLSILNPLMEADLSSQQGPDLLGAIENTVLGSMEQKRETQIEQILLLLMSGFAVLCLDGSSDALVFGVQGFETRGPDEPQHEVMLRGAKDGFTESYQNNISMIRRRMKTTALKFEKAEAGSRSHTPLALCYLEGVASPEILEQLRQRLKSYDLDTTLGAGYLVSFLERGGVFSGVGHTQPPHQLSGNKQEARVAKNLDRTPPPNHVPKRPGVAP